jgi:Rps23 Pro-64 3,4-dihydroxylase Tpa1-like proline 4-hydroxylase
MEFINLRTNYKLATPFPHIVIDELIDIEDAKQCVSEMKKYEMWGHDSSEYSKKAQVKKYFTPWCDDNIEDIKKQMPLTWKYLQFFNSPEFIQHLENLTGIKGLIADDLYEGGGCHKIDSGGRLSIHTDYAKHPRKDLYRRINLLLYLNEDWQDEWGGTLQLWKHDMSELVSEVQPKMNRAVIFNTTSKSLHGHPNPLNSPEGVSRYSIALYYFTKEKFEDSDAIAATWYDVETKLD